MLDRIDLPSVIPSKPCRPERRLVCTHAHLLGLRAHGVDVFECAHDWIDDASIAYEVAYGDDQDLTRPHDDDSHRAGRIATMVRMMQRGVVFDPLFLFVVAHAGGPTHLHLVDGHHRLRATRWQAAFGRGHADLCFNLGGDLEMVKRLREWLGR